MKNKKRLYIVHGYGASITSHWFPWLKEDMQEEGFEVKRVFLPDSENPKARLWLESLKRTILEIDEGSFFVSHSLGCTTTLRFLQEIAYPKKIGGYILVAGFYGVIPEMESIPAFAHISYEAKIALKEFSDYDIDYSYLSCVAENRAVIASMNDSILPFEFNMSRDLASNLGAKFYGIEKGGHFLSGDGYETFPLVKDLLIKMSEDI